MNIQPLKIIVALLALCLIGQAWAENVELQKDNGKRWQIPAAMMTHLNAMEAALKKPAPKSLEEHHKLANVLQNSLNSLVASCTMEGKAHDQLHSWLVPYMAKVKAYAETKNLKSAQQHQSALAQSFTGFHQYFETAKGD